MDNRNVLKYTFLALFHARILCDGIIKAFKQSTNFKNIEILSEVLLQRRVCLAAALSCVQLNSKRNIPNHLYYKGLLASQDILALDHHTEVAVSLCSRLYANLILRVSN